MEIAASRTEHRIRRIRAMREIDLQEYRKSGPIPLTPDRRDELMEAIPSLTVTPASGEEDAYHLTPASVIGAFEIGDLSVSIQPKLDISQVIFMACYAMGKLQLREMERFDFKEAPTLPDALALSLTAAARKAFERGLLHGYRAEEETLYTVRGRIRMDEQIRRRFGIPVPVEVRYDEFTDDILANRLVKAAVWRLGRGRMRIRSPEARDGLRSIAARLGSVSLVEFPPKHVPEVTFDRLNERYREVVALSRLILRHDVFETGRGDVRAAGFQMDMNKVFQEFVTQALREDLRVSDRILRSDKKVVSLDKKERISLKPDLSWWDGDRCTFVGDVKYKRITDDRVPNADLYQLLAYATALDLPGGLLIYAQGEGGSADHWVRHSCKRLGVAELDLTGDVDALLSRIRLLAGRIRCFRDEFRRQRLRSAA